MNLVIENKHIYDRNDKNSTTIISKYHKEILKKAEMAKILEKNEMKSTSLKYGILAVYVENPNDLWIDADKQHAYVTDITDLIGYFKITLMHKLNAEVTDKLISFHKLAMMEEICSWCDKDEYVNTIFIIGHSNFFDKYENNVNITEVIEKVTTRQMMKRYANIVEVTARLESKIICRMRNKTLIINLYGLSDKEAVTCIDEIVTATKHKIKLIQGEIKQAIIFSSSNTTNQVNCMNKEKRESSPSSDKSIKKIGVANEMTSDAQSLSEEIKTEEHSSIGIEMKKLNILSQDVNDVSDEEFYLSEVSDEDMENTIYKQYPMITVEEALFKIKQIVIFKAQERNYEMIKIDKAHGRILAEIVYASSDLSAFRVSTKHGFAVLASDGAGKRIVLNKTTSDPVPLKCGTCMYVKSGDRVPDEATAVVQNQDVERINDTASNVKIKIKPKFGQNIKDISSDIKRDKPIIKSFTRIGPSELGLLAAVGRQKVRVVKPIPIGILSIGDLLEEPGKFLKPGYVYDSNRISIIALLKDKGFNSIVDFGIVTDKCNDIILSPIIKKIKNALNQVDLLVTVGCSSDKDLLKIILVNNFEATIHFGNVFLKPGKSTMFATCKFESKLKYLVCLPKDPVSARISAHLFLLPILNRLHNIVEMLYKIPVYINERYTLHQRPRAVWAILEWNEQDYFVRAFRNENLTSDKLSSCQANALLLFPSKTKMNYDMSFVPAYLTN